MKRSYNQLPTVAVNVLLALSLRPRHGYEIIKQVREDSNDKVQLGPGALYTSIKQLREQGLIVEVKQPDDTRRRYYKLTDSGLAALSAEIEQYEQAAKLARQRHVLTFAPSHG